ncbi:type I-B CRISPR-associated protein Cas8b1/Cst1 [Tissierella creatinophila]|uniref:CRISPR-associated protein n=1 Tax=Tissierella creatinophila DSM 6911 TaxID=1123403 RepID=A0A1U7M8J6_TISCR|nr:type I-B CRISPR-associated protein Cas8b1/Cst1 [Tissierella creatinophila]OLS03601.1 CRISPR-associated protein [Tissierella creatinophila DSM 6911]
MEENIRLELSDWQFNAGLLGFYNILNHAGDDIIVGENYIEFNIDVFEQFEEKYFDYLIYTYEGITHWDRFNKYFDYLSESKKEDFLNLNQKDISRLNDIIKELKGYLKRPNYSKVYEFIEGGIDILELQKSLDTIKIKKGETIEDIKQDIYKQYNVLKNIHKYVYSSKGKKYLFAKTLIYNIINQSWEGVAFLNRNTKQNDIYIDYKETFIDRTVEYLKEDKGKFKLNCFITGLPIKSKSSAYDMGFLIDTGFDTNRKTSHVWDFNNDIFICALARMIYSCMPCGMFFSTSEAGIFVNANQKMDNLIKVNNNIKQSIKRSLKESETNRNLYVYKALIEAMEKENLSTSIYELSDVQVIRKESGKYRFNILSKEIIEIFQQSNNQLLSLIKVGYKEGKTYNYIYPLTIERILNGVNMFTLIHRLLVNKLTTSDGITNFFSVNHIKVLNKVNINFLKGVGALDTSIDRNKLIEDANRNGWYLGEEYKKMKNREKVKGISYRLLNSLKTRNSESFLHNLLNSYMYVGKQVPKGLVEVLEDEEKLGVIGYAFVTGLVSSALNETDKTNIEIKGEK